MQVLKIDMSHNSENCLMSLTIEIEETKTVLSLEKKL